ncbi:MAG: sigma-70 family RNA polymerase sigma factor [Bacteroidaceae bacterium]|nr:sigma-70 family RNA polymerase sigma factor [Bacteroidaceae bacterium]MBR5934654.1 sigma-70 family RNA polymerase sigma factor [Bacteroidaceae bacterium]
MSKTFLSEKELISGCIRKDRDAQGMLYARYSPRLYTLCLRYLEDTEEARDLMHDSIIKAFDSIRSFRKSSESSLYVWLRKITLNLVFDRLKENNRFSGISLEQVSEDDIQIVEEFDIEPSQEIPEFVFKQAMSALPPVRRAVFNMYYVDELSHKEIAKALGITERGSTSILAKARTSIRNAINDYIKTTGQ